MPAINVAKTDTFERQRQKINQIGDQIFNIAQGGSDLSTGNLKLGDGTRVAPSLGFVNDTKLGVYRPSLGVLGFVSAEKNILDLSLDGGKWYNDYRLVKKELTTGQTTITAAGQNYDEGSYTDITLTGGSGQFGTGDITVTGAEGTLTNGGSGYAAGQYNGVALTGGTGSGLEVSITVDDTEIELTSGGSGYVDGFYSAIPLTGGTGTGAEIGFSVGSGAITAVTLSDPGSGYTNGDVLSVDPAFDGVGSGSNFSVTVTTFPGVVTDCTIFSAGSGYTTGDVLGVNPSFDGVGSGSNFAFTLGNIGFVTSVVINNSGIGYDAGDILSVNPVDLTSPIAIVNYVNPVSVITFTGTIAAGTFTTSDTISTPGGVASTLSVTAETTIAGEANNTYTAVAGTGGTGSGVTFDVARGFDGAVSTVTINSGGAFYTAADAITIAGNLVGGSSPADNITLTIDTVSTAGLAVGIYKVVESGGNLSYLITEPAGVSNGDTLIRTAAPTVGLTTNTVNDRNKYFLDTGSGQALTPDLTFYVGSKYSFNTSDSSNSSHPFGLSIHPNGIHNTVTKTSVTLTAASNQITVSSNAGILLGMLVSLESGGTGEIGFGTTVQSINGNVITLSSNVETSGTSDVKFAGAPYTDGVVTSANSIEITVSATTPTPLYYYCEVHPNMGSEDGNEATITIDANNPKTFGSGFQLTVNGVAESEPIKTNVLTGDFAANSFTGTSATLTSLNVNTLTANQTISTNVLTVDTQINSTNLDISATSITVDSNLTVGVIDVNKVTGDVTTSGAIKTTNELNVNDLTKITNAGKLTSLGTSDLVLSPAVGRVAKVEGLTSLVIPKGTTLDRPGAAIVEDGAIRYNTDTNQYEGYNSGTTSWSSLGGVRDIDGNTYILAELTAGANDNTLWFYNDSVNTVRFTPTSFEFHAVKELSSVKLGIPTYTVWTANSPVTTGQYLKYRNNLYEVTSSGTTATVGSEPTHTSGVQNNGTAQLTWSQLAVGPITFNDAEEVQIGPFKNTPLVIGQELKLDDNTISTQVQDLIIQPNAGKQVIVDSVTHFRIPAGNNNQKSIASPGPGSIRFNTEIQQFEGYSGTNWSSLGGVRDVDGNTYIIPETAPAANENILYFYNNNVNTIQLTETALDFTNVDTVTTSGGNTLAIETAIFTLNSNDTTIDNSDVTKTFVHTSKQYLDLGLSSGLNVDPVLRLDNQGDVYLNTTFGSGSFNGVKIFDGDLKEFELSDYKIKSSTFTLDKGGLESSAVVLYSSGTSKGCKVTVVSKSSSGKRSMSEYAVIDNGTDIVHSEYASLNTSDDQYTASFDFTASTEPRITLTLTNDHATSDVINFTVLVQEIK